MNILFEKCPFRHRMRQAEEIKNTGKTPIFTKTLGWYSPNLIILFSVRANRKMAGSIVNTSTKFCSQKLRPLARPGKTNQRGRRLGTVDHLANVASTAKSIHCYIKNWQSKLIVQGGQLYWAFPCSKGSVARLLRLCLLAFATDKNF
jgi:hypothetical protein